MALAAIGVGIAAAGFVKGIMDSSKAEGEAKKAARAQRRIAAAQAARKRRAQVREAQVKQGNIEAAGAAQGGAGTSSNVAVAQASLGTQLASNLTFLSNTSAESNEATNSLRRAAAFRSDAAMAQSIGNFAMQNSSRIDNLFASSGSDTTEG